MEVHRSSGCSSIGHRRSIGKIHLVTNKVSMLNPRGAGGFGKRQMTIFRFISSFGTGLQLHLDLTYPGGLRMPFHSSQAVPLHLIPILFDPWLRVAWARMPESSRPRGRAKPAHRPLLGDPGLSFRNDCLAKTFLTRTALANLKRAGYRQVVMATHSRYTGRRPIGFVLW